VERALEAACDLNWHLVSAVDNPMGRELKANVTFRDRKLITLRG
jgi:hypothetical protein